MVNKRWVSLDVIKAITVVAMIIVHNVIWWLSFHPSVARSAIDSWFIIIGLLSFFVMMIPVTAGAALYFYFGQHKQKKLPPFTSVLKRALLLVSVGFIMNTLAFGSEYMFQWNVLQFFSLGMIILFLVVNYLNIRWLLFFGLVSVLVAPILRVALSTYNDLYIVSIMIGEPNGAHFWPLFPWFSLLVTGYSVAYVFFVNQAALKKSYLVIASGVTLIIFTIISGPMVLEFDFKNLWGENIFQPPVMQVFGIIGVALCLFGLVELLNSKKVQLPYSSLQVFGVGLFYTYVVHMILGHQLQLRVLRNYEEISFLWLAIICQIILAYYIGKLAAQKTSVTQHGL